MRFSDYIEMFLNNFSNYFVLEMAFSCVYIGSRIEI